MHRHPYGVVFVSTIALAVAGCGGGGGSGVESIPAPAPAPNPAPASPPAPPPIPTGPIGLQSSAPFSTQAAYLTSSGLAAGADAVQFSYSAADNAYTITLPDHEPGQLVLKSGNGSYSNSSEWLTFNGTNSSVRVGSGAALQPVTVTLNWPGSSTLAYTSFGQWRNDGQSDPRGYFAYGIPTAAPDMPTAGAATYAGDVRGMDNSNIFVSGSVTLSFDFAAGTLSGSMKPELVPWDAIPLGTYEFRDTVYSRGSTSFSGAFTVPGSSADSSFNGSFNGPQAGEFMASWQAPYVTSGGQTGTMAGIWTGKKN